MRHGVVEDDPAKAQSAGRYNYPGLFLFSW